MEDYKMEDYVYSSVTGKKYLPKDGIRLLNIKQSILYLKNGCELLDLYTSVDYKTGEPVLCFIFNRQESKKYFDLWCKHELK